MTCTCLKEGHVKCSVLDLQENKRRERTSICLTATRGFLSSCASTIEAVRWWEARSDGRWSLVEQVSTKPGGDDDGENNLQR
ncbi:hypothetical protein MRB53_004204 [Persea americana]|uniref:Uncharacterized protein n=1 Tax=Persea americana TaxID=3435 RepID=A0ACC2MZS6_PERAE|nr:hypothetical protein MRB53_004204 [Persea americana]